MTDEHNDDIVRLMMTEVDQAMAISDGFKPALGAIAKAAIEIGDHAKFTQRAIITGISTECLLMAAYMSYGDQTLESFLDLARAAFKSAENQRTEVAGHG